MSSSNTALIVGNGQQARVIASLLPHQSKRFLVERDPGADEVLQSQAFAGLPDPQADYFIAIGHNGARRRIFDQLVAWGVEPASCIAQNAWIAGDAQLGKGLFIGPGAIIMAGCQIGNNVIVNTASSVDHDCLVGEDSQNTPGVTTDSSIWIRPRCPPGCSPWPWRRAWSRRCRSAT